MGASLRRQLTELSSAASMLSQVLSFCTRLELLQNATFLSGLCSTIAVGQQQEEKKHDLQDDDRCVLCDQDS
jgi:hypothetical protein